MKAQLGPVPGSPALSVSGLSAGYRRRAVLHDATLDIDAGLVHGIIGPNGAGKSTLLKACLGLLPSQGRLLVHGHDVRAVTARDRARLMAYLPQQVATTSRLTGRAYVQMGRYARQPRFGGISADDERAVEEALRLTGSAGWADRPVMHASGGERQLIALARAIAQDAAILMLDEPVAALDLGHELAVLRLLRPWIAGSPQSRTAVLVLHDLTLAARFCDRLTLLVDGQVGATGAPDEVLVASNLRDAYGVDVNISTLPATGTIAVTPL
ncbi:ABC transporter ATP-binding protein [Propionibacterium sp.]|uniref:ABC transporter ATP-binding protein n=1 Tax=Propionibacterium sp. TaxID=1977903 RepID=UPI0039E9F913